jgi:hypothetical protein
MNAMTIKIIGGCAAFAVVVIALVGIKDGRNATAPSDSTVVVAPEKIHSSDWYLAHRDVLKVDEQRCVGNASTISAAACQNVKEAVGELDNSNFQSLLQQDQKSNN